MKKPIPAFILSTALLFAATVCAEIYKYTDENGQKRWTDDLSQVPKEQRAAAQRIESEDEKPADATAGDAQRTQPSPPLDAKAAVPDSGAANETAELSREALENEKAELDLMYQQLLEEREQIEKLTPEALSFQARAELNYRITAFNQKTEQYEAKSNAFKEKINTYNQQIMSKRPAQGGKP
ncbi:MAG: DUF4124 domain-containing protein [Desulfosarcina sp.]|nr:DUF4124 domain-containing protein [Desulfosarcina sp.]